MSEIIEVLITSDANASHFSCSSWDPSTGTNLIAYKGGGAANPHSCNLINNKFLITANSTKPLAHIWPINNQDQVPGIRFVLPGKANALTVSPDGNYLIAGIQESLYVWQLCSGKMINLLTKHYQLITTIKFTDDSSHFISAGQDGYVIVWNLTAICRPGNQLHEPLYTFNDHALSVTDIFLSGKGIHAILCTVSIDRTCKLYDLSSGKMLLNVVCNEALTCVTMDTLVSNVYVGTTTGIIYTFNINLPPRTKEYHIEDIDYENKFMGHNGNSVITLSLSLDGKILCSGGNDGNVHLWDIDSKQLLRTILHTGPITNAYFTMTSKNIFNPAITYSLIAGNLKRMMDTTEHIVEIYVSNEDNENTTQESVTVKNSLDNNSTDVLNQLRFENQMLRKINKDFFESACENLISE